MIVKFCKERGKNKNSRGRRELNLTRIILCHHKNFRGARPERERMVKTGQEQGATTVLPYLGTRFTRGTPNGNTSF
jgi:hypothetical protein